MPEKNEELEQDQSKPKDKTEGKPEEVESKTNDELKADVIDAEVVEPEPKAEKKSEAKPDSKSDAADKGSVKIAAKKLDPAKRAGERAKALAGAVKSPSFRSTAIKLAAVVVAMAAIVLTVFGVLIYKYKSESPAVRIVAKYIPYPVERVNGRFVSYSDYLFEVDANEKAYQNNAKLNNQPAVDFKSADGKKLLVQIKQHAMEKLKSDAVVAQLASQKKVKVTDKEVNELISQLYDRYGGKDTLLKTLNQIYGWDLNDLKVVIRKQLLQKNLEEKVTSDPAVDAAAKSKAQDVLKEVKDGGNFGDLAKKYSQASDAANGGDLGFFTKGQLPDNVQSAAEALQPDQVSDVIKTDYGYEILKVVEKKDDGSIHGLHILIKTIDFTDYFNQELEKAKVTKYISV